MSRQAHLDVLLKRIAREARLLPAMTASNGVAERARLVELIAHRRPARPEWKEPRAQVEPSIWRLLDQARGAARDARAGGLYLAKLDELELELSMIDSLGTPRLIRPLAARRFGTGEARVPVGSGELRLSSVAARMLEELEDEREERVIPARLQHDGSPSLEGIMRAVGQAAGLEIEVKVDPRLVANAAAGDRTVFLADRHFGRRESLRLAVHEILGHLVAAANGRAQPLGIFAVGTAGSFATQEGLAIFLEEQAGALDGHRLRTLAARVLATDAMHEGAEFEEVALLFVVEHGFTVADAVTLAERAFRGGGAARDVVYLRGWLEVRAAVASGRASVEELRAGKLGWADLPAFRRLKVAGLARDGVYRPSFSRSLEATGVGTSLETSPPSLVTSLQRLLAT